jgi:hypothetical protein
MTYAGPIHNVFLYHAHALALGGWVRDKKGQYTALPSVAPSVLSITGGFCSASEKRINFRVPGRYTFGEDGPKDFYLYIGHAYTEVRGVGSDKEDDAFGTYHTTVRSVLDDVFINDEFHVEHAEAILSSKHLKPGKSDDDPEEARIMVGRSNMAGVHVKGAPVTLQRHRLDVDQEPTFNGLHKRLAAHERELATAGKGGTDGDALIKDLCDWSDPAAVPNDAPAYVHDLAGMNQRAKSHIRYSLFKSAAVPAGTPDVTAFNSSLEVKGFGRVFLGEVMVSHGTKQLTMFRLNLGCDNCGDVGGSGGTTNGSTYPP